MSPVVIGAGPAGLTAAYELAKRNVRPQVFEKSHDAGGISRTATYKGYRFDIGGHRFFTKVGEVEALWHEILGDDFISVPRLSRIFYDGKFYPYPLKIKETLLNLGPVESLRILASYAWTQLRQPYPNPENLEEWVTNRFGDRLYRTFFKTYTEKVWGIPCTEIRADWAAQRIKTLSLTRAVYNALTSRGSDTTLINEFQYPRLGPGMMWDRCVEHVERMDGTVSFGTEVVRVEHEDGQVTRVHVRDADGEHAIEASHVINSMPITHLIRRLDPQPPEAILAAAHGLKYRDFLIVSIVVDREEMFPDNWIYIHSPEVQVGRIQNFKNWSPEMVPDLSKTCLGMEYFCNQHDNLWDSDDDTLIRLASEELVKIGLADSTSEVIDGTVIRQPMAYPVYDETYKEHLGVIQGYLDTFSNLYTTGRAGMHRYNNQDHSMLTAMLAVKNLLGESHDLWNVNVERSYHEDFKVGEAAKKRAALEAAQTAEQVAA
ncbi:MAG: NAD(P)/FAD-dependent oxidoreductase [Bacteroidota bacterium]